MTETISNSSVNEREPRVKQTHQPRKTDREANTLTQMEVFQMWTELKKMEKELQLERPSNEEVATRLTQLLGFKVTEHNVMGARQQGCVDWRARNSSTGKTGKKSAVRKELEALTTLYRERMEFLEGTVRKLYKELNINFPEHRSMAPVSNSEL